MEKTILLLDSHAEIFLKVAQSVVEHLAGKGEKIEIWDVSSLSYPQWGALSSSALEETFDGLEVTIRRKNLFNIREIFKKQPESIRQQIHFYSVERHVGESRGRQISRFLLRTYLRGTIRSAERIASEIESGKVKVGKVLIRNGRSPWQHVLRSELHKFANVELGYYDFPFFWGKEYAFLGPHPVHDRESYQADSLKAQNRTFSAIGEWRDHHRERMQSKWRFQDQTAVYKVAVMSSSTFEFMSMPDVWNTGTFKDQYEGFSETLELLDPSGGSSVLRIHPNLQNAPWRVQLSDFKRVRWLKKKHPGLTIVWHFEETDSYAIIRNCEFVVVSISTIGLEAIAMDKKVLAVGSNFYDLVCNVALQNAHIRRPEREKKGAEQILGHLKSLCLPMGSYTDSRSSAKRIRDSLSQNPIMSLYTYQLEVTNSWSSRFGVLVTKIRVQIGNRG